MSSVSKAQMLFRNNADTELTFLVRNFKRQFKGTFKIVVMANINRSFRAYIGYPAAVLSMIMVFLCFLFCVRIIGLLCFKMSLSLRRVGTEDE